ncbi:hypothetical protein SAMN05660909_03731 [Chitinophaga terrae (ex Kim and Jung 2007)]|uniref:Uncharacterized protein n=1 Tax=Chitinophaga terrae (ex Kim and Jung 2007) TaxID=408074 RepID=A0A1H4EIC0_9BACT|nr:hypothetical protein SAMN05660909_03731 [Chitinophaga terrae (ex Kim and Jung 2007)]
MILVMNKSVCTKNTQVNAANYPVMYFFIKYLFSKKLLLPGRKELLLH